MASGDPFYNRKPVPDEFLEGVGYTGLSPAEETVNRERKFSTDAGDIRDFWNPKSRGKLDPYYQRKPVPDGLIAGIGDTGLTKEQEYLNRERKYSLHGADVRRFSSSTKGGWHPIDDPYYGRKPLAKAQIDGVGETQLSKAEEFETRENKASLFDLSSDPFQQLSGAGHRASVSGIAGIQAIVGERRRSSAIAPDAAKAAAAHHHSGYDGDAKLAPVESRVDEDQITPSTQSAVNGGSAGLSNNPVGTGQATYHDAATRDDIAPHEKV